MDTATLIAVPPHWPTQTAGAPARTTTVSRHRPPTPSRRNKTPVVLIGAPKTQSIWYKGNGSGASNDGKTNDRVKQAERERPITAQAPRRYCEDNALFGCDAHTWIHRTSVVLTGVTLVTDVVAGGCALAAVPTAGTSLLCSGAFAAVGTATGSAAAALDVVDMATGGMPWTASAVIADVMAPVTLGASKWISRMPHGIEAATRGERLSEKYAGIQRDNAVTLGFSGFDVMGFIDGFLGWND